MLITTIFANSPFDKELRFSCKQVKMNTKKYGEVCVLPNHCNIIFEVQDTVVELSCDDGKNEKVKIDGSAIAKIEDNNLNIFGQFSKIDENKK
ncbi:MAG: hypothetical protein IJT14_03575 [Rickettsiales bacterium]|nr:hypothetical protein [Rickettsiales bacterium]